MLLLVLNAKSFPLLKALAAPRGKSFPCAPFSDFVSLLKKKWSTASAEILGEQVICGDLFFFLLMPQPYIGDKLYANA